MKNVPISQVEMSGDKSDDHTVLAAAVRGLRNPDPIRFLRPGTDDGALFQMLQRFYGTDRVPFTFVSDEFNGVTRDNNGNVRPLRPRSFSRLSEGITQGEQVADYVYFRTYRPTR